MATRKKSSSKRYSKKANNKIARVMREAKRGTLRSGRSGKKVKSRKQAVAIAISEARREGDKVPPNPNEKAASSGGRKKASSSGGRKKASSSGGRKKASSSGGRKKASSSGGRKRSTERRGGTSRRKSSRSTTR